MTSMIKLATVLSLLLFSVSMLLAQQPIEQGYFKSPLDIPLVAAGSFGELRTNHFHTGVDFKTQGKEGLNVYASAMGFVSRIKVSGGGYGLALYIKHPNGFTTVYGHLQSFNPTINSYVKKEQYARRLSEVDLIIPDNLISINKGDIIGLSGNSGSSQGPHLHYEIRETASEHPINPLLFGFDLEDNVKPEIFDLLVYKFVDGVSQPVFGSSKKFISKSGYFTLNESPIKVAESQIGFAIRAFDKMDAANNKFGIYELQMEVDGQAYFQYDFDRLSFPENRYINAHIDYAEKLNVNKTYQRCFKISGNQLSIYNDQVNNGILNLNDNKVRDIKIYIKDFNGNAITCNFQVQKINEPADDLLFTCATPMVHYQTNSFNKTGISINLPENAMYEDICFSYFEAPPKSDKSILSPVYYLHHKDVPLHKPYELSIKPDESILPNIRKAVICYLDGKDREQACDTKWDGELLKATPRNFGKFYIKLDTEKPKITKGNFKKGGTYTAKSVLRFGLTDNLSGIRSYQARLNGRWAIINYDKNRLIFKDFSSAFKGKNTLIIGADDKTGNFIEYEASFIMK